MTNGSEGRFQRIVWVISMALGMPSMAMADESGQSDTGMAEDRHAETRDSKKGEKKKRVSFAGTPIPMFNPVVDWGIGAVGIAAYKLDKRDKVSPPSSTMIFGFGSAHRNLDRFPFSVQMFLREAQPTISDS